MWLLDSGASSTMGKTKAVGISLVPGSSRRVSVKVTTSNKDAALEITSACDLLLKSNVGGPPVSLKRVLVSNKLSRSLLSTSSICEDNQGMSAVMTKDAAYLVRNLQWTGEVCAEGVCIDGLYLFPSTPEDLKKLKCYQQEVSFLSFTGMGSVKLANPSCMLAKTYTGDLTLREVLHVRTGHVYCEHVDKVYGHHYGTRDMSSKHRLCHTCGIMNIERTSLKPTKAPVLRGLLKPLPKLAKGETKLLPGEQLHHDWQTRRRRGKSREGYTGTNLVACKGTGRLFPILCKSEADVQEGVITLKKWVETDTGRTTKIIHGDSSAVNRGSTLGGACLETGTRTTFSPPYVKERNGFIESQVKVFKRVGRCIDYHAGGLPGSLWPHTDAHACLIINVVPVKQRGVKGYASRLDLWEGKVKPKRLKVLRAYGCLAMAYLYPEQRNGSGERGARCVYLGQCLRTWSFIFLAIKSRKIIRTVHASFDETQFPFRTTGWLPKPVKTDYEVDGDDTSGDEVVDITDTRAKTSGKPMGTTAGDPESVDEGVRGETSYERIGVNYPESTNTEPSYVEPEVSDHKYNTDNKDNTAEDIGDRVEEVEDIAHDSYLPDAKTNSPVHDLPDLERGSPVKEKCASPVKKENTEISPELRLDATEPWFETPTPTGTPPSSPPTSRRYPSRVRRQVDIGPALSHQASTSGHLTVEMETEYRTEESNAIAVSHYLKNGCFPDLGLRPEPEQVGSDSKTSEPNSEDVFGLHTESGEECCFFTVPIDVVGGTASYKGVKVNEIPIPRNFNHVKNNMFRDEWEGAMDDEYNPLVEKGTWIPVYKEGGDRVMGCLWVYNLKVDTGKKTMRFKARLCAQGSGRTMGVDHTEEEIYANVLKLKTLRINLALAIQDPDARVAHWDIKNAFVATDMPKNKRILMRQPQGYYVHAGQVLKLVKALYGLPESMRLFTDNLKDHLIEFGFTRCKSDPSMYVYQQGKEWIRVPVWVDDLFPTYNSVRLKDKVFAHIQGVITEKFDLKDLGELSDALGVQFKCDWEGGRIEMRMERHKLKLLSSTGMEDCNPALVPMTKVLEKPTHPPTPAEESETQKILKGTEFRSVVGSIGYMVQAACPLLSYAHSSLSRFNNAPTPEAARALRHVLRYIKGTVEEPLVYTRRSVGPSLRLVSFPGHNSPKVNVRLVDELML